LGVGGGEVYSRGPAGKIPQGKNYTGLKGKRGGERVREEGKFRGKDDC